MPKRYWPPPAHSLGRFLFFLRRTTNMEASDTTTIAPTTAKTAPALANPTFGASVAPTAVVPSLLDEAAVSLPVVVTE